MGICKKNRRRKRLATPHANWSTCNFQKIKFDQNKTCNCNCNLNNIRWENKNMYVNISVQIVLHRHGDPFVEDKQLNVAELIMHLTKTEQVPPATLCTISWQNACPHQRVWKVMSQSRTGSSVFAQSARSARTVCGVFLPQWAGCRFSRLFVRS